MNSNNTPNNSTNTISDSTHSELSITAEMTSSSVDNSEVGSIDSDQSVSEREAILLADDAPKPAVDLDDGSGYMDMAGGRARDAAVDFQPTDDTTPIEDLHSSGDAANAAAVQLKTRQPYDTTSIGLVVFRADGRAPDEVFHSGFVKRDIHSLIRVENSPFNSDIGAFGGVSTTTDTTIAHDYALGIKGRYLYAVKLSEGGIAVPTRLRGESLHETVNHYIAPEDIIFSVGPFVDEESKGELRINPHSEADTAAALQAFDQLEPHIAPGQLDFVERYQLRETLFFNEHESRMPAGDPNNEVTLRDIRRTLRHEREKRLSVGDVNQAVNNQVNKLNTRYQRTLSATGSPHEASIGFLQGFRRILSRLNHLLKNDLQVTGDLIKLKTVAIKNKAASTNSLGLELPSLGYIRSNKNSAYYTSGFSKIQINIDIRAYQSISEGAALLQQDLAQVRSDLTKLASKPAGNALLHRIINSKPQNVSRQLADKVVINISRKKGVGFSEAVLIDNGKLEQVDVYYNLSELDAKITNVKDSPSFISLGHELIHALHDLEGTSIDDQVNRFGEEQATVGLNEFDNLEKSQGKTQATEFLQTAVTENLLRKEHGLPLRLKYYTEQFERISYLGDIFHQLGAVLDMRERKITALDLFDYNGQMASIRLLETAIERLNVVVDKHPANRLAGDLLGILYIQKDMLEKTAKQLVSGTGQGKQGPLPANFDPYQNELHDVYKGVTDQLKVFKAIIQDSELSDQQKTALQEKIDRHFNKLAEVYDATPGQDDSRRDSQHTASDRLFHDAERGGGLNQLSDASINRLSRLTAVNNSQTSQTKLKVKAVAAQTPGVALQLWGIYSGVKAAEHAFKQGNIEEGVVQTGAVMANLSAIPAEIYFNRKLAEIGQRIISRASQSGVRFAATSSQLGKLLGRSGGVGAALITLPFDIYSAYKAFSDAGAEGLTDKQRQDLYVQGSFAVAGAVISLGLGVAAIATGSVALGPAGLGLSVGLIVASQIYSAVRQVEAVWDYVPEMDDWRYRLRQGWLAFWGKDMDQWVIDAYRVNKTHADYLQQTYQRTEQLLTGELGNTVDTVVLGNFTVETQREQVWDGKGNVSWENFPQVIGADDLIDAREGVSNAVRKVFGEQHAEKAVLFNLGEGQDVVYGVTNKKNEFIFGAGSKRLYGGTLNDNFTFSGGLQSIVDFVNQGEEGIYFKLDGKGGENNFTLNTDTFNKWASEGSAKQRYYGFIIDLGKGVVWLKRMGKTGFAAKGPRIGTLKNIQHTLGAGAGMATGDGNNGYSDIIYGSDDSNRILANYGDRVYARGGNDVITLTDHAVVDGGSGQDIYLVQRGLRQAEISEDGGDISLIRLEYSLAEITSWQLVGTDLQFSFNDLNSKTLMVKDVYQEKNGQLLLLNNKLSFQTQDGFMLMPLLEKQLVKSDEPIPIQLAARYLKAGDKNYYGIANGVGIDLRGNQIDGTNEGGKYQQHDFSLLDKSQLVVLAKKGNYTGHEAGSKFFIERGRGLIAIKPQAQSPANHVERDNAVNILYLDYDASEIMSIRTQYRVEHYSHGYYRKDHHLLLTLVDGRKLVLQNIIDTTTHAGDALSFGGKTLRDYRFITRDGIAYSLQDTAIISSRYLSKRLAHESHYHDKTHEGVKTVNNDDLMIKENYTLTDWQWGIGRLLSDTYQLSAEGTVYDDHLIGDERANVIRGYGGDDFLRGNDGHDTYVIGATAGTVTIDNFAADNKLDSLVFATNFENILSKRINKDLFLTATFANPLYTQGGSEEYIVRQVKVTGYFASSGHQHLLVASNEGTLQQFISTEPGTVRSVVVEPDKQQEMDQIIQALSGFGEQSVSSVPLNGHNNPSVSSSSTVITTPS